MLLVTDKLATRLKHAVGLNVTWMLQLALTARVAPQLFVWLNSAALVPVIVIEKMLIDAVPVF